MTDLELNTDRSQVVSFRVEVNGSVNSSDFRLKVESGQGYDLSFPGTFDGKNVKFDLPRLSDSIGSGKRNFVLEMIADKEAFFSPLKGSMNLKKTLTVGAKAVTEGDSKITVSVKPAVTVKQLPISALKESVVKEEPEEFIEINVDF